MVAETRSFIFRWRSRFRRRRVCLSSLLRLRGTGVIPWIDCWFFRDGMGSSRFQMLNSPTKNPNYSIPDQWCHSHTRVDPWTWNRRSGNATFYLAANNQLLSKSMWIVFGSTNAKSMWKSEVNDVSTLFFFKQGTFTLQLIESRSNKKEKTK